jgi:hypothetical protein
MGGKSSHMQDDKADIIRHTKAQCQQTLTNKKCFTNHYCIKDSLAFGNIVPINGVLIATK